MQITRSIAIASLPRLARFATMLLLTSCTVVTKKSKDGEYIFSVKSDGTGVNVQPILPTPTSSADNPTNTTTAATPKPSPTVSPQVCEKFAYQPSVIGIPAQPGKVIREMTIRSCKIQRIAIQGEKGVKLTVDGGGTGIAVIRGSKVLTQSSKATKGIASTVLPYTGLYNIEAVSRNSQTYSISFTFDWSAIKNNP